MKNPYPILLMLCLGFISCSKENSTPKSKTVAIDYEFTTSLAAGYTVKFYDPNLNQEIMEVFYGTSWSYKFTATVNNNTNIYLSITDYSSPGAFQSNCSEQVLVDGQVKKTNTAILIHDGQSFETGYTIIF